jgi:hypothetical protein
MFDVRSAKAQVRRMRVQDLRHSCATLLFPTGVEAATVQRILRHSPITVTTSTYAQVVEPVKRDGLDAAGVFFDRGDEGDESTCQLRSQSSSPTKRPSPRMGEGLSRVELRGLEPLTLTLPV